MRHTLSLKRQIIKGDSLVIIQFRSYERRDFDYIKIHYDFSADPFCCDCFN